MQKKYVESKGKAFGTVSGDTMCSGPFKLDSWKTGQGVKMVPNPDYWDTSLPTPKVTSVTVIGAGRCDLTAGLRPAARSTARTAPGSAPCGQMQKTLAERLPGCAVRHRVMVVSATKGPLADVAGPPGALESHRPPGHHRHGLPGGRQHPARGAANGTWGYAKSTFQSAYDALPAMTQNLSKAKTDAKAAGIVGQTITIGTSSGIPTVQTETLAVQQAAQAIGSR